MSRKHASRIVLLLALTASLAGCGGSNEATESVTTTPTTTPPTTTTASTTTATTTTATTTAGTTTVPPQVPTTITIQVVDGKPQGGIVRPSVEHDERVLLIVKSDTADEVHLHGYDLSADVAAGGTARLGFTATIRGRFEVELENTGVQIAEITVN